MNKYSGPDHLTPIAGYKDSRAESINKLVRRIKQTLNDKLQPAICTSSTEVKYLALKFSLRNHQEIAGILQFTKQTIDVKAHYLLKNFGCNRFTEVYDIIVKLAMTEPLATLGQFLINQQQKPLVQKLQLRLVK
jgi:hypothetical protein